MNLAVIAVGYNRPKSLSRLLSSLHQAYYDGLETTLIISLDQSYNKEVEDVANNYAWPFGKKRVVLHPKRIGLRNHILGCGNYTQEFDAVIVLEDDLYVSPLFMRFARQALKKYDGDPQISGISLYSHLWNVHVARPFAPAEDGTDVYFLQFAQSWGQVWSRRMWDEFYQWYLRQKGNVANWGDIPAYVKNWPESSWLKHQIAFLIENKRHFVYPRVSLTTNFGEPGQHVASLDSTFQVPLLFGKKEEFSFPDFKTSTVKYDAFFERAGLAQHLGIKEGDLCTDLYGAKGNSSGKRYWLTMNHCKFARVKSFGLLMRPQEINIILSIPGDDLFVYDTTRVADNVFGRLSPPIKQVLYDIKSITRNNLMMITAHHLKLTLKRMLYCLCSKASRNQIFN